MATFFTITVFAGILKLVPTYEVSFISVLISDSFSVFPGPIFLAQTTANETFVINTIEEISTNSTTTDGGENFLLKHKSLLRVLIRDNPRAYTVGSLYTCDHARKDESCEFMYLADGETIAFGNLNMTDLSMSWDLTNDSYRSFTNITIAYLSEFRVFFKYWSSVSDEHNSSTYPLEARTKIDECKDNTIIKCIVWGTQNEMNISFVINGIIIDGNCSTFRYGLDMHLCKVSIYRTHVSTADCVCTFNGQVVKIWKIVATKTDKHLKKRELSDSETEDVLMSTPPVISSKTVKQSTDITIVTIPDASFITKENKNRSRRQSIGIIACVIFLLATVGILIVVSKIGCPCHGARRSQITLLIEARRSGQCP